MNEPRTHIQNGLRSGLTYGVGVVLGTALAYLLLSIANLDFLSSIIPIPRFILGILLALIIMGIAGGIGGFAGGDSLKMVGRERGRFGYAWRSAWPYAIPFSLVIFLDALAASLLNFYNVENTSIRAYIILFMIVGALFGLVYGILLGLVTARRQGFFRILFVSILVKLEPDEGGRIQ
jgi:hypothetical protein